MTSARTRGTPGGMRARSYTDRVSGAARDLAYLAAGMLTSVVAMATWIAGVSVTLSLAVFVVGIPAFILTPLAFRGAAELDRSNAARLRGAPVRGHYRDHGGRSLFARVGATARDPQTWSRPPPTSSWPRR
jgi:Putative sensor